MSINITASLSEELPCSALPLRSTTIGAENNERFMALRGYANRSEGDTPISPGPACSRAPRKSAARNSALPCSSTFMITTSANYRKRLTADLHHHHDLAQATLHVHLDRHSCMEVTVLKGRGSDVQHFADHIIAERGVRHGHVVYLPAQHAHSHAKRMASRPARKNNHAR